MNQRDISRSILQDRPLIVLPQLACDIGLNEAIVLQQLFWLLGDPRNGKRIAEKQWIFNTVDQWRAQYFPFWSGETIKRVFASLAKRRLIETCQPEGVVSRRKYYRVNTEELALISERCRRGQNDLIEESSLNPSSYRDFSSDKSKESKETSASADASVFASQWKPNLGTKSEKLARLQNPADFPSERAFDAVVASDGLDNIAEYRPDLYSTLCDAKWHQWKEGLRKWVPIRDWRKYIVAFNEKLCPSF